jgi:hypothetical protein
MFVVSERSIVQNWAVREVMEQAGEEINKRCVDEFVRHAKIEKMPRYIGRVSSAIFGVALLASMASVLVR